MMSDTSKKFEDCERCEGTGDHHVHMPTFYDPYYMSRTNRPCEYCDGKGKIEVEDDESDVLSDLWESVNALGGYRPSERNYDQGFVDGIGAALAEIEKARGEHSDAL